VLHCTLSSLACRGSYFLSCSVFIVTQVGDIEADVLERTKLELCVPGLYRLNYEISCPVDDEHMQCRFEKSSKVLTVKMPRIAS